MGFVVLSLCLSLLGCSDKNSDSAGSAEISPLVISSGNFNADAQDKKPVLHVLIAASDTNLRPRQIDDAGQAEKHGAAEGAETLAEFFLRQKAGTLYSDVVIRTMINDEFSKSAFLAALDEIKIGIKTGDVFILHFSAYSGIDKNGDFFIIPGNGKTSFRRKNISFGDIAKKTMTFPVHNALILADTNRGDWKTARTKTHKRLNLVSHIAESPDGRLVLCMQNNSAAALMEKFENFAGADRYMAVSHFIPDITADYLILDSRLDPGTLHISTLFPGTISVMGNDGTEENFFLDSQESTTLQLPEGTYSINIVYRNSHQESRTAEVFNNLNISIAFNYRPNIGARNFTGTLPALGVNIAELNPQNYRRIDQNILGAMGMEQYRISFLAGEKLYQNGDYDKAIAEYNRCISLRANYADAYTGRGSAYRKKGNYTRALEDYSRAIEYGGGRAEVYNYRGFVYAERGETEKAILDYSQALRLKRDYADAYINRGHAYYEKCDYDRAIDDYSQVIRLEPRNAPAWNRRGSAWYRKAEDDKAISDFSQAIAIKPDYALAWHNRGNVWYNRGDYERALADLNQAIKLNPSSAAYNSRGNILQRMGDISGAEADFTAAR